MQRLLNSSFTEDDDIPQIVIEPKSHLAARALQDCPFHGRLGREIR